MVIDGAGAGLTIQCPRCSRDVTVPGDPETTPSAVPPPAAASRSEKEQTVALKWSPPVAPPRKDKNG